MEKKNYFNLSAEDTVRELNSDAVSGLSEAGAKERLSQYGNNELVQKKGISAIVIFFDQFKNGGKN